MFDILYFNVLFYNESNLMLALNNKGYLLQGFLDPTTNCKYVLLNI